MDAVSAVSCVLLFLFQIHVAVVDSREDPEEDADDRKDDPGARPSVIHEAGNQVNGRGKREDDARNDTDHLVFLGLILRELANREQFLVGFVLDAVEDKQEDADCDEAEQKHKRQTILFPEKDDGKQHRDGRQDAERDPNRDSDGQPRTEGFVISFQSGVGCGVELDPFLLKFKLLFLHPVKNEQRDAGCDKDEQRHERQYIHQVARTASLTISVAGKVLTEKQAGWAHDAQENTCRHRPGEVMTMIDILVDLFGGKVDFVSKIFCR